MRNRVNILNDLVYLIGDLSDVQRELSQYSWDTEDPIFIIKKIDFSNILRKCIGEEISFDVLEDWANAIECRDDLGFEDEKMQEIIFELANPEINGEISKERLKEILKMFNKQ